MAINTTIFTTNRTLQKPEILAWLQANATDYFDSIAVNESGDIVCSLSNGASFTFDFNTAKTLYKITDKAGNVYPLYSNSTTMADDYTIEGKVTSHGIMFVGTSTNTSVMTVVISKTNNSSTCLAMHSRIGSTGTNLYSRFIDLKNEVSPITSKSNTDNVQYITPITSLSPVVFGSGEYCEHVFLVMFTNLTSYCTVQINGKKYAYSGLLALEE